MPRPVDAVVLITTVFVYLVDITYGGCFAGEVQEFVFCRSIRLQTETVHCSLENVAVIRTVTIDEHIDGHCTGSRLNYGYTENTVWVSNGCSALFEVCGITVKKPEQTTSRNSPARPSTSAASIENTEITDISHLLPTEISTVNSTKSDEPNKDILTTNWVQLTSVQSPSTSKPTTEVVDNYTSLFSVTIRFSMFEQSFLAKSVSTTSPEVTATGSNNFKTPELTSPTITNPMSTAETIFGHDFSATATFDKSKTNVTPASSSTPVTNPKLIGATAYDTDLPETTTTTATGTSDLNIVPKSPSTTENNPTYPTPYGSDSPVTLSYAIDSSTSNIYPMSSFTGTRPKLTGLTIYGTDSPVLAKTTLASSMPSIIPVSLSTTPETNLTKSTAFDADSFEEETPTTASSTRHIFPISTLRTVRIPTFATTQVPGLDSTIKQTTTATGSSTSSSIIPMSSSTAVNLKLTGAAAYSTGSSRDETTTTDHSTVSSDDVPMSTSTAATSTLTGTQTYATASDVNAQRSTTSSASTSSVVTSSSPKHVIAFTSPITMTPMTTVNQRFTILPTTLTSLQDIVPTTFTIDVIAGLITGGLLFVLLCLVLVYIFTSRKPCSKVTPNSVA